MIEEISVGFPYKPEKGCFGFSTSLLITGNRKKILFDVGNLGIRSSILPLVNIVDCVVISHLHFDHCANLDLFINTGIQIYISKKEMDYYNANKHSDADLFSYFEYIRDSLNIVVLSKNTLIDSCIKVILTKGHTPGHLSLEIINGSDKILLAGDAIKSYKDYSNDNYYGNSVNPIDYVNTKKRIKKEYNIIYPGHSGKIVNGKEIKKVEVSEF